MTFDYYFPAIFEAEKGVKLFKVSSRKRTCQGRWAGRKERQRTAAVQDANAHTRAITFAPAFWWFIQRLLPGGAAVDARSFFPSSFQDQFSLGTIPALRVWLISSCPFGTINKRPGGLWGFERRSAFLWDVSATGNRVTLCLVVACQSGEGPPHSRTLARGSRNCVEVKRLVAPVPGSFQGQLHCR